MWLAMYSKAVSLLLAFEVRQRLAFEGEGRV